MRKAFDFLFDEGLDSSPLGNGAILGEWQVWAATFAPSMRLYLTGKLYNVSIGAAAPTT